MLRFMSGCNRLDTSPQAPTVSLPSRKHCIPIPPGCNSTPAIVDNSHHPRINQTEENGYGACLVTLPTAPVCDNSPFFPAP